MVRKSYISMYPIFSKYMLFIGAEKQNSGAGFIVDKYLDSADPYNIESTGQTTF
jgi:hypothetical protein